MATIMRIGGGAVTSPEPSEWEYLTTFVTSGTYTESESPGSWIRLWAHGAGGDGGRGGGAQNYTNYGSYGGGGGSGSNGAIGCSILYLNQNESIQIVIDDIKTQVILPDGTVSYAENGSNGTDGGKGPYNRGEPIQCGAGGTCPTIAAKAYTFNVFNIDGELGNNGQDGRLGTTSTSPMGGNGGDAASMSALSPYGSTPPAPGGARSENSGSYISVRNPGGDAVSSSTPPICLGGAGGGGSGIYSLGDSKNDDTGTAGGAGAIGGVVIEKGVV